jgi:hypothetical protein
VWLVEIIRQIEAIGIGNLLPNEQLPGLFFNLKLQEILYPHCLQSRAKHSRKGYQADLFIYELGVDEMVILILPPQRTASIGCDVIIPVNFSAISQRNHKAILKRLCDNRYLIQLAALSTNMTQDGKMTEPFPRKVDGYLVRKTFVDDPYSIQRGLFHRLPFLVLVFINTVHV